MDVKRCPRCQIVKPVGEYYRNRARKDGIGVYCVACQNTIDDDREARQRHHLIALLGGACVDCGYTANTHALQIDHVSGGGGAERRAGGPAWPSALLRDVLAQPDKYQLLCANCNMIKRVREGEFVGARVYSRVVPSPTDLPGSLAVKLCPRCSTVKPVSEYYRDDSRVDGIQGWCRECVREARAARVRRQRGELIEFLGDRCKECGFAHPDALHVDHVNGGGSEARRNSNGHPRTLLRLVTANPTAFQLLCANCNMIKRISNGELRGSRCYKRNPPTARVLVGRAEASRATTLRADVRQAVLLALIAERRPIERSPTQLPVGSWSRWYRRCAGCQSDTRRHAANGLCTACYGRATGITRRIPQQVKPTIS